MKACVFKILVLLFGVLFFTHPLSIYAKEFKTDYKVDYYLNLNDNLPETKVKFRIDVTTYSSDSYIKKFSLQFPKYFKISNPTALYNDPVTPQLSTVGETTKLEMEFPKVTIGKNATSTIYVDFDQDHLFSINGDIWEVILPTLQVDKDSSYQITLHLPDNANKTVSISKPTPDSINGSTITWNNPTTKTVYAIFGTHQLYNLNLTYHLQNTKAIPVYTEVAFPPDTSFQKIFISSVSPQPTDVSIDQDGNYIARYDLRPNEKKDVILHELVSVMKSPRPEVVAYERTQIQTQKNYLLSSNKYWNLNIKTNLNDVKDIFSYVVSSLQYNTNIAEAKRVGALEALKHPDQAVCTEFTDTFVALARQKGIYAREIEGFGYSNDDQLRPLSLKSDVLHAWPEYYDSSSQEWTQADPTWQNTSGIDYFSSLDLDHIAFAIHGQDPEYPLPAGAYKTTETKDVQVVPVSLDPTEKQSLKLLSFNLPKKLIANKTYASSFTVQNTSNVYLWNIPVKVEAGTIKVEHPQTTIDVLAPFQKKSVEVDYAVPQENSTVSDSVSITLNNLSTVQQNTLIMPYYYDLGMKIGGGIIVLASLFITILFLLKHRN